MSKHVKIGVFIPNGAQTLDTACADVLGVMSKEYLSLDPSRPAHITALAPDMTFSYITTPAQGREIPLTSGLVIKATHDYTEAEVAPGKLDIVVVPGPDLPVELDEGGLRWLREQSEAPGVDVLCICTGIFVCGAAGIVDGKQASGPRGLQDMINKRFPRIKLVGGKHRWVQDGNFWASGGITNGNDLMAAYARASSKHWPPSIVEIGLRLTDVGDRGQFYEESTS
ncbi:Isonitrile hydratase [Tolypocladium ophioglossoides CBS 100239]|uniref:Isonitrile hydratase n=1 Tax=Tolypocladium ophioglossoides (strain CBS 100239) TaxID=1163406 RepID=A0A0L0N8W8_TOLOC|nr:Isonitrile hydratase [Tolypocladium ophioglossoides CBS 100239]